MNKRPICAFFALLMLSVLMLSMPSTTAWVYPDCTEDAKFETFGPRADKLLIQLYADQSAEFEALKAGDIDVTDFSLSKMQYEVLTSPPYDEIIKVVNYGPEFSFFMLDMNNNGNEFLGNPPDPTYPNPVADHNPATGNPLIGGGAGPANDYNPLNSVYLRRAIGYLIDRPSIIISCVGPGFAYPLYTPMPLVKYALDIYGDPSVPWAWSVDAAAAIEMLDANGFPVNPATGYRYWDRNLNGNEEPDEYVELVFYIRVDHPIYECIGTILWLALADINIRVNPILATSGTIFINVMINKDYHLHIGSYKLGCRPDVDPDFLYDFFHSSQYWHPGICPNYNGIMNEYLDFRLEQLKFANTQEEAVSGAHGAQWEFAYYAFKYPILMLSGNKAHSKTYVGDTPWEQAAGYTGKNWTGVVNIMGYGTDNTWSFMNMHPEGFETGTGNMTIRWGFSVPEIRQLNPIYASSCHDWKVLDKIYESLVVRNASDLNQFLPWIAESFEVGTYMHPVLGICSKVTVTLRNDVYWSDGTPLTTADVEFTFVELKQILEARGLPPPFWWSNVKDILSFSILDPYNFEVLLDVKSYWALSWVGENIILPKHIWKPIAETGDPQQDQPDPDCIGSGPWRFDEYNDVAKYVKLVANRPGSTVHGVTSPQGYWRFSPRSQEESRLVATPSGIKPYRLLYNSSAAFLMGEENLFAERSINVTTEMYVDEVLVHNVTFTLGPGESAIAELLFFDFHFRARRLLKLSRTTEYVPCSYIKVTTEATYHGRWVLTFGGVDVYECPECSTKTFKIVDKIHICWINLAAEVPPFDTYVLYWGTIKEDIAGSTLYDDIGYPTYPYKIQLTSPDFKVDIKDVALAAKGFGSYPGHPRWIPIADINGDYQIDIKDIAAIALQFGWVPP